MSKISEDFNIGNTEIKLRNLIVKRLWENPNQAVGAEFPAQDVVLNSSDYDYLEFYFRGGQSVTISVKVSKGKGGQALYLIGTKQTSEHLAYRVREFKYINDTTYHFDNGFYQPLNNDLWGEYTTVLIPLLILGYKE